MPRDRRSVPYKGYWFRVEYSPDEGGYYGEVFNDAGADVATTEVFRLPFDARTECYRIIDGRASKDG